MGDMPLENQVYIEDKIVKILILNDRPSRRCKYGGQRQLNCWVEFNVDNFSEA